MPAIPSAPQPLTYKRILHTWWPLAASWLLMSLELPVVSAVIARLPDPEINLAAYGGVIFPIALIIESPIIMLLAASTALSRDWESYVRMRRFMVRVGALLTTLHLLIALTPAYYVVVEGLIGAPPEIVEPSRVGLIIMTPWAWSIGYRRFNQGVLIRFDHSRAIGVGTGIRLGTEWLALVAAYLIGTVPGNIVGPSAVTVGVVSEAVYVGLRVRPVLRDELRVAPPVTPLTFREFIAFYVPLALTSFLNLFVQPLGSAALSRMPLALASLAAWPVASGFGFVFRSPGVAYNEVVVALLDEPGAVRRLRRFAWILGGCVFMLILLVVATPLARLWLGDLSALAPALVDLARPAMWLLLPLPLLLPIQSYFQGTLVNSRRTRGVTEAIVVFLVVSGLMLALGVIYGRIPGLRVGLATFTAATAAQTAWLWVRSRPVLAAQEAAEASPVAPVL